MATTIILVLVAIVGGFAFALEDGELAGDALTWSSDRQGVLGHGSQIVLPPAWLLPGSHQITLTATDSSGRSGRATTTVLLGSRLYLPVIMQARP